MVDLMGQRKAQMVDMTAGGCTRRGGSGEGVMLQSVGAPVQPSRMLHTAC